MIADLELYIAGLLIFAVPALLMSTPAYYILNKKNRIFIADYFLPAYAITFLSALFKFFAPAYVDEAISNLLEDYFLVAIVSIAINYVKIYIPYRVSTKFLSISSIVIIFIITILLFLFIPSTGE